MQSSKMLILPPRLRPSLQQTRRRLRWQAAMRLLLPTFSLGLLATLLLILAGWLYPLAQPLWLLALGLGLIFSSLLAMLLYVLLRPYNSLELARLLDQRLHLDERLSTALELATNGRETPSHIIQNQLTDTLRQLKGLDLSQALPLQFSWRWLTVSNILMIAIAVTLLLPNPQSQILQQRANTKKILTEQKNKLAEIRAELLSDEALQALPELAPSLQSLDELIADLEEQNLSPEEALAALSETEEELAALQNALAQETTLNDLAHSFDQFSSTTGLAEAIRRRDLNQAKEFLETAANNPPGNPEASQNLADSLRQAAQTAQQNGDEALAEALSEAAEAMEQMAQSQTAQGADSQGEAQASQEAQGANSQSQASQEALQQAAEALANAGQANSEALEKALGNIQEARQQLAEAAGQGQGQDQQAGQGQGQQAGQGPGQGQGATPFNQPGGGGSGAGRGDSGPGAADLYADRPGSELETDNGPNEGRSDQYEANYPPIHWGGEGGPLVNPDQQGVEGGIPIGDAPVNPDQEPGAALVPYNQVYGQYADAAGEALDETYIPLGMKEYVRNYFGALEPE